jgi:hypothetical protein
MTPTSRYMMAGAGAEDQNGAGAPIDLPMATNGRWVCLDLDEILEGIEFAGLPQTELVATYVDSRAHRRFVRVRAHRKEARR